MYVECVGVPAECMCMRESACAYVWVYVCVRVTLKERGMLERVCVCESACVSV